MGATPLDAVREARRNAVLFGRFVTFAHSVFALPFALSGVVFAYHATGAPLRWSTWLWVVVAMVGARSSAMAMNRILDRHIDARNPRTRHRELPSGALGLGAAWGIALTAAAVFVFAASRLNPLCLRLTPVALAVVWGYSFTKRFAWGSHLVLGLSLAIAPVGGWAAVTGRLDAAPFVLALAVLTWVAGFDVFYALQDRDFDRAHGLHSIPVRFGAVGAFRAARLLHVVTVLALVALGPMLRLSVLYFVGVAVVAALLVYEHTLVRPDDLSRLNRAFFELNGVIGVLYFATALGGTLL